MEIEHVILFVSSSSKASQPCVQFLMQNQIQIPIVRLDTPEARHAAKNGQYFQITNVPSLIVKYQNGTVQQFTSVEKVMNKIQSILQPPSEDVSPPQRKPKTKRPKIVEYMESDSDEDSSSDEEPSPPPKKRKQPKKYKTVSKPKEPKEPKEPTVSEDIEFFEDDDEPDDGRAPPPPTAGLMVGPNASKPKAKMEDLMASAKKMAEARKGQLGEFDKKKIRKR